MDRKVVVVYETSNVNRLSIENTGTIDIYIQSGDIVKGGKQDRTIAMDFIIPPKSGKQPLDAFCVEHGRCASAGARRQGSSPAPSQALASKNLKLAAKSAGDQTAVWAEVSKAQDKLNVTVNGGVNSPVSASSYQLSLENKKLQEMTDEYVKASRSAWKARAT